jgi:methyl-accepting chemotaxis protein
MVEKLSIRTILNLFFGIFAAGLALLAGLQYYLGGGAIHVTVQGAAAALLVVVFILAQVIGNERSKRAETAVAALNAMNKGDLAHDVLLSGTDEYAWISWECQNARKGLSGLVHNISGNTGRLAHAAEQLADISEQSKTGVERQSRETQQLATAMNEMSKSFQEVARNAANAADAALEADRESKKSFEVVQSTTGTIERLATEVDRTAVVITKLEEECNNIGKVLDVIRDIAEQTNLLALNAAIEAARAGEQGRGFAVVADEVRTLASRTQHSTQEIQGMIERLQRGAAEAVKAMEQGRLKADDSVQQATRAGQSLGAIIRMVDLIRDMNTQIASAAEEQSATAEEINRNVININAISTETAREANAVAEASGEVERLALELQGSIGHFKLSS